MLKLEVSPQVPTATGIDVVVHGSAALPGQLPRLAAYRQGRGPCPLSVHPAWLTVLQDSLGHTPYCIEAVERGQTRGLLPLCYVHTFLFGRFLVGMPYLNYGGAMADDDRIAGLLIDRAVQMAQELKVRYL